MVFSFCDAVNFSFSFHSFPIITCPKVLLQLYCQTFPLSRYIFTSLY
uniref:Uncharacterized protein n=1 Tax=Siphoviridae sp. cttuu15 TaxID=2825709 RepID=A0A8S5U1F3_9CAUD|nr:MAG TPA: hypothetical protein [Siphoviridae sp. cttuu15]DAK75804.1 MAG TPA: hypothetical protein [Caudoviricetes sp.]DAO63293.1 MAG TPA: hypothetical protein [Caudoviricetes sp.]DAY60931.1 MAG TPA: hypothetical protein [Caudoviricetes sp.]